MVQFNRHLTVLWGNFNLIAIVRTKEYYRGSIFYGNIVFVT